MKIKATVDFTLDVAKEKGETKKDVLNRIKEDLEDIEILLNYMPRWGFKVKVK